MTPFNLTDLRDRDTLHQRWLNKGVKIRMKTEILISLSKKGAEIIGVLVSTSLRINF